ncbi:MAG: hypothetical protein AB2691_00740 [Candidatus Thiodiazotropha sp.]
MADAGGPGSVRKCPGVALADLGDTEGFGKDGAEDRLYAFQLSEGVYKRKEVTLEGVGSLKFGELSDVDVSQAVARRLHTLAFTGSRWVAFADPAQQAGWLIDINLSSPYVVTGKGHKIRKVVNSGTRLCSLIPETRNVIIAEAPDRFSYLLKTGNNRQGALKMVSEFPPAGIIGLGLSLSTIVFKIFLGDRPDDFVDVLPGFKLKWPQKHSNKDLGVYTLVKETPQVQFTLKDIQHQVDYRLLDLARIYLGPTSLKRLRFTPGELTPDQSTAIIEQ